MAKLPQDTVRKILLNLPIKSLVRCRVVEKAWDAWITEDRFVEEYLVHHAGEDHDNIIVHKDQISMLFHDRESIICPSSESLQVVGSLRGIVCLRHGLKYALWNPALHKFVVFSAPSMDFLLGLLNKPFLDLDLTCPKMVGLGFDPNKNEYKVVVCYKLGSWDDLGLVYLPRTSTWKTFDIPDYLLNPKTSFAYSLDRASPSVIANCCPYWSNCSRILSDDSEASEAFYHLRVVKFDVKINKFKSLPLFKYPVFGASHRFMKLKDSPTVLRYEFDDEESSMKMGVYCLDSEDDSGVWTCNYNLGPITLDVNDLKWYWLQGFRYGVEIILQEANRIGNARIIKEPRRYLLYDVESATRKFLQGTTSGELRSCYSYTPTLALLPGMSSVYSHTYDPAIGSWPVFPWQLIHSLGFLSNQEENEDD